MTENEIDGRDPDDPTPPDPADARLLDAVAEVYGADPPPPGMTGRIAELFALRDLDRELVELLTAAQPETAGVRGPAEAATDELSFELADGTVSLEVRVHSGGLDGQVVVGELTAVSLESPTGVQRTVPVDGLGRFRLDAVDGGPVRLVLVGRSDRPSTTDWFLL